MRFVPANVTARWRRAYARSYRMQCTPVPRIETFNAESHFPVPGRVLLNSKGCVGTLAAFLAPDEIKPAPAD